MENFEPVFTLKLAFNTPMRFLLNVKNPNAMPKLAEIGAEIELEGFGCYDMEAYLQGKIANGEKTCWVPDKDPSLRGESTELVLGKPLSKVDFFNKALPEYEEMIKRCNFKPALSNRCSYHVHLDFSRKTLYSFIKFMTLYALLEEYFFEKVGKLRKGNQFCVSLTESKVFVDWVVRAIRRQNFDDFGENMRYMACNLASLHKFGSIEIRLHEGVWEPDRVALWVAVLHEIMTYANRNYDYTPAQYLEQVSMSGLDGFIKRILPVTWNFIKDVYHTVEGRANIDAAQDIAYAVSMKNAPSHAEDILEKQAEVCKRPAFKVNWQEIDPGNHRKPIRVDNMRILDDILDDPEENPF